MRITMLRAKRTTATLTQKRSKTRRRTTRKRRKRRRTTRRENTRVLLAQRVRSRKSNRARVTQTAVIKSLALLQQQGWWLCQPAWWLYQPACWLHQLGTLGLLGHAYQSMTIIR